MNEDKAFYTVAAVVVTAQLALYGVVGWAIYRLVEWVTR